MDGLKTRLPSEETSSPPFICKNLSQSDFLPQDLSNLSIEPIEPLSESVVEPEITPLRLRQTTS